VHVEHDFEVAVGEGREPAGVAGRQRVARGEREGERALARQPRGEGRVKQDLARRGAVVGLGGGGDGPARGGGEAAAAAGAEELGDDEDGEDDEEEDAVIEVGGRPVPREVMAEVLRRLGPRGVMAAAGVSRGWRDCAGRVWRAADELRLRVLAASGAGLLGALLPRCPALSRLQLRMER